MSIVYRGSLCTPMMEGNPALNSQVNVFAIVNTFRSRAVVNVLRIVVQLDVNQSPTGNVANRVMPVFRTRRCQANDVSGGVEITYRAAFDTNVNSPDPGVKILYSAGNFGLPEKNIIVSSAESQLWQQYTARQASQVGQQISWDNFQLPCISVSDKFILRKGEALVIEQVAAIPTGGVSFCNIAWEEDQTDAGYNVAGNVKAAETNIEGAKVFVITDSDTDMLNPELEVLQTNASGNFSKTLGSDVKAAVFVQYRDGETLYSDEGKPYIQKS